MKKKHLIIFLLLPFAWAHSQDKKTYRMRTIAFYNVENLFDIVNDTLTFDNERTPEGKDKWTRIRYTHKINSIAGVINKIGPNENQASPAIIGLAEIENFQVLQDLISNSTVSKKNYKIIHFDSPDRRGIDVALLYRQAIFLPISFQSRRLLIYEEEDRKYTRDQLVVEGLLDDELFYFIVNHWPSRSGGEAKSEPYRLAAARLNKKIIDSILKITPNAKIISMGDLNDDPTSDSLKKVLKTVGNKKHLQEGQLFNPMERLYRKGVGSLAYRDEWFLFDQFFFSSNLIHTNTTSYLFWKAGVFAPSYLKTQKGPYKGYPFRTYAGGSYTGGYSDHFPVYICLLRKE